ncbi:hypothetical protein DL96DRAFT_1682504 [Flagelloscypha sp. PMI_526]|nr:hypothetical protein DL96DRAFT_1682504 [Flagelloscypha sp. PMI_526]
MAMPLSVSLPFEILDKIIVLAADSGGSAVALPLCTVSHAFHESAVKRLYHTIQVSYQHDLEKILDGPILHRPWIAFWVRVLIVETCGSDLLKKALKIFAAVHSLRIPYSATIDHACMLPHLRRLNQLSGGNIPSHIAQNLTHLQFYGIPSQCITQIIDRKNTFQCLSHLIVLDSVADERDVSLTLNLLRRCSRQGFPDSLLVFILAMGLFDYEYLVVKPLLTDSIDEILSQDKRIVLWNQDPGDVPEGWEGPFIFDFQSQGLLVEQVLGAVPDGAIGIWESVQRWMKTMGQNSTES